MQQKRLNSKQAAKAGQPDDRKLVEDIRRYKGIILRGWRFVGFFVLASVTAAIIFIAGQKPTYRAATQLLVIQQNNQPVNVSGGNGMGNNPRPEDNLATHLLLLRSPVLIEQALNIAGTKSVSVGSVIANVTARQPDPAAKIIEISFKSQSADDCRLVLDGIVQSYKQFLKSNYEKSSTGVIGLIKNARDDLNKELRDLEKAYLEYRQKNPAYSADSDGHTFVSRRLDQWDQTLTQFSARALQLQSQLELGKKMAREGVDPDSIARALNQLGPIGGDIPTGQGGGATGATNDGTYLGIAKELTEVESRRKMAELYVENFEREHHQSGTIKPVSDAEIERAFLADPAVDDLVRQMDRVDQQLAYAKRVARFSTDHAVSIQAKRADELKKDYERLWEAKRPEIAARLHEMANPNLGEGYRLAEAELVALRARESALRARLDQVAVEELKKLQSQHDKMKAEHGEKHALVVQLKQRIDEIEGRQARDDESSERTDTEALLDYMAQSLKSIESMRSDLQKQFDEDLAVSKKAEIAQLEESNLKSNLERQRTLFNSVVDQLKQASLVKDFESVSMQTIAPTTVGAEPSRMIPILFFSLIVGLGLGSGAAFMSDMLEAKVRTLAELRKLVDVPLIGIIPMLAEDDPTATGTAALLSHHKPRSALAEAYRTLRTNLEFQRRSRQARIILVTSPLPGDGKTTTVCNLAITLANTGRRVLLVDGDLRKPSLHQFFDVMHHTGFSDALLSNSPVDRLVKGTFIPNLDLLTTGEQVANPAELLASDRLADVIRDFRSQYDVVLIDSSPLLHVTDPSIIAALSDGIVLVARISSTRRHDLDTTNDLINTLGVPVFGMVINGVPSGEVKYGYGYGYGYGVKPGSPNGPSDESALGASGSLAHGVPKDAAESERLRLGGYAVRKTAS